MTRHTQFSPDGCPFCAGRVEDTVKNDGQESRLAARHMPHCPHPEWLAKPDTAWWRRDWKREGRPTFWKLQPEEQSRMQSQLHGFLKRQENGA